MVIKEKEKKSKKDKKIGIEKEEKNKIEEKKVILTIYKIIK